MSRREYEGYGSVNAPFGRGTVVTTHDTNALPFSTRAIYVGGAGNITARFHGASADTLLTGLLVGNVYHFSLSHIRATGTTATNIVALD